MRTDMVCVGCGCRMGTAASALCDRCVTEEQNAREHSQYREGLALLDKASGNCHFCGSDRYIGNDDEVYCWGCDYGAVRSMAMVAYARRMS